MLATGIGVTATLLDPSSLFVDLAMPNTTPTTFSPKLHATFEASLKEYEKETEINLLTHSLMAQLQDCNSPADILVVLRSQVSQSEQTTSADEKFIIGLDPIVNVLSPSSPVISTYIGLVSPIWVIFLRFNSNHMSRYSHLQMSFSLVPVSSFRKLSPSIILAQSNLISNPYRPRREILRASMRSLSSSSESEISSYRSRDMPKCWRPER